MRMSFLVMRNMRYVLLAIAVAGMVSNVDAGPAWQELPSLVGTPRQVCSMIRHHVRYRADLGDEWATGEETWKRGYGDCEDFAFSVVELCRKVGLDARVAIVHPEGSLEGHAVVVGTYKGQFWVSSNGWYEEVKDLSTAWKSVARQLRWKKVAVAVKELPEARGHVAVAAR